MEQFRNAIDHGQMKHDGKSFYVQKLATGAASEYYGKRIKNPFHEQIKLAEEKAKRLKLATLEARKKS